MHLASTFVRPPTEPRLETRRLLELGIVGALFALIYSPTSADVFGDSTIVVLTLLLGSGGARPGSLNSPFRSFF